MIVFMQFRSLRGPFCRPCGTAYTKKMSVETAVLGWWGLASFFITPIVLLMNWSLLRRLAQLPDQAPGMTRPLS